MTLVKICGITRPEDAAAAVEAGADFVGLTFFPRSPRSISVDRAGAVLAVVPPSVIKTALTVDADDALLAQLTDLGFDLLQVHGEESPERVAAVKARTGLPVMKAIGVRTAADVAGIDAYTDVADRLLIDAKAPKGAVAPGGNGVTFDWTLLSGQSWPIPWLLAGGLTPDNVADAVRQTGAAGVDLASGVEASPGIKDHAKIRAFVGAAKATACDRSAECA